jgi:hypothetical protein
MIAKDKYKDVTIKGSVFPDAPIKSTLPIALNSTIKNEYLPALQRVMGNDPKGFQLLLTAMTHKEGFTKGTRSYRFNNPGNIGNTDSGANQGFTTLDAGILAQRQYIIDIVNGKNSSFPMGGLKVLKPYFSEEINRNPQYGLPPYVPGYSFVFTGQIDQFVKIYSTGARAGNSYISTILSYFNQNGIAITPQSLIQDIIQKI